MAGTIRAGVRRYRSERACQGRGHEMVALTRSTSLAALTRLVVRTVTVCSKVASL
jgi:hypothetical protein